MTNEDEEIDEMLNDEPNSSAGEDDYIFADNGEEEEMIFENENSIDEAGISNLHGVVQTYNAFMWKYPAVIIDQSSVFLKIPSVFIPLAMKIVYGFNVDETLLEIKLELTEFSWRKMPRKIELKHPVYKKNYIGKPLVSQVISNFFSKFYEPKQSYRSACYLLAPPGSADSEKAKILRAEGFESNLVENALRLFQNDVDKSREFLRTGAKPPEDTKIHIEYSNCPLLYLVLEICETFLDLPDHCCVCGAELKQPGIKPAVCDKQLCQFALQELGIGNNLYQEIRRDPLAADLVFSFFATALYDDYCKPRPSNYSVDQLKSICSSMPSMLYLVDACRSDEDLLNILGNDKMSVLRWVILSNRAQLISLPYELELQQFKNPKTKMFMILLSTPKKEEIFRSKQQKYSSIFLWHGSAATRWHSILRNGLVNASGTSMQLNGAALGSGIYFARSSSTSKEYSFPQANGYKQSLLGKDLKCIGLCEVANVPSLKDHGWAHTLTDEEAVIVRFLLVGYDKSYDVINNPPVDLPTLKDVLDYQANHPESINNITISK